MLPHILRSISNFSYLSSWWIHQLAISNAPTHPPCWHYQDSRRNRSPIPGMFQHFGQVVDKKKTKKHLKSKNRSSRAENCWEMVSSVAKQMDAPGLIRKIYLGKPLKTSQLVFSVKGGGGTPPFR